MPSSPILVEDNELDALLSKNTVDPTTFGGNQAVKNLHFLRDKRGNLLALATISVAPNNNPITAGTLGSVKVQDATASSQLLAVDATGKIGVNNLVPSPAPTNSAVITDNTTATYTQADQTNTGFRGIIALWNVTAQVGAGTWQPEIDWKAPDGTYVAYPVTIAPTTGAVKAIITIYPAPLVYMTTAAASSNQTTWGNPGGGGQGINSGMIPSVLGTTFRLQTIKAAPITSFASTISYSLVI